MIALLQLGAGPAPAAAVRDTVAAIVGQVAFRRSVRTSLLSRMWSAVERLLEWLRDALPRGVHARQVAIVCVIVLALLVVLRVAHAARLRDETARRRSRRASAAGSATDPAAEARALAAAGRFTEAAHALYRALLQLLARREKLRLHPSKTSGDYARELRARRSPLHAPFRAFGRRYDRMLFGHEPLDADAYATLLEEARPLLQAGTGA